MAGVPIDQLDPATRAKVEAELAKQRPPAKAPAAPKAPRAPAAPKAAPAAKATPTRSAPATKPAPTGGAVDAGAGWLLGLIGYALVASYVRYGPKGPRSWLSAKFINKPTIGASGGDGGFGWSAIQGAIGNIGKTAAKAGTQ